MVLITKLIFGADPPDFPPCCCTGPDAFAIAVDGELPAGGGLPGVGIVLGGGGFPGPGSIPVGGGGLPGGGGGNAPGALIEPSDDN